MSINQCLVYFYPLEALLVMFIHRCHSFGDEHLICCIIDWFLLILKNSSRLRFADLHLLVNFFQDVLKFVTSKTEKKVQGSRAG
jgi:hypothetical protein